MKHYLLIFICFFLFVPYIDARCKTAGWNPYWDGPPRLEQVRKNILYETILDYCFPPDFIDINQTVLGGVAEKS